jgi:hypothetical protein
MPSTIPTRVSRSGITQSIEERAAGMHATSTFHRPSGTFAIVNGPGRRRTSPQTGVTSRDPAGEDADEDQPLRETIADDLAGKAVRRGSEHRTEVDHGAQLVGVTVNHRG